MRLFLLFIFWSISTVIAIGLITQPISVQAQLCVSITGIAICLTIYLLRLQGVWRYVFLATATAVILRYAYWRTTATLPSADHLTNFIPAIVLYIAEMYCLLMLAMSLFVVSDPIERKRARELDEGELPTVDVFVPSYNEGADILSLTLSAAKAMDYPADKLNVFLLDDGGTDQKRGSGDPVTAAAAQHRHVELQALCAELGVHYRTRPANLRAKAGNLNSGLAATQGDLVVVFDADHAPAREFLRETVGHFHDDPRLFLVQTPHFFSNPDPLERNLGTFKAMPSENEMFYGTIQKGLDKWNAAFFCGSAAVLRRAALEEVGGFSGVSITEDCETALDLHSRGWNSLYVDRPMISGLQPDTFASFIGQRSRWCRGMIQILLLKNPALRSGLSLAQRICYLSSALFWFFPFMRMVFMAAPLLFILFDLKVYNASVQEFTAYTITYLIIGEILRNYLYGQVRWPWISELYEYVQSVYLVRAIVSVLVNPRRPTFNVTAKGETLQETALSELARPFFAIVAVLLFTFAVSVYRYQTEPEVGGLLLVVGAWNLLNLMVASAALGVVIEQRERRTAPRLGLKRRAELCVDDILYPVVTEDVSLGGARLLPTGALPTIVGTTEARLLVSVAGDPHHLGSIPVSLKASTSGEGGIAYGVRFKASIRHYPLIAELMLADISDLRSHRENRQARRSIVTGTLAFLKWAAVYPFLACHHLFFTRSGSRDAHGASDTARASA
ncbi:cellulose synthase [Aureimonas sp. Leaf454]|uniref:UDP-forming cellulose synthase catalytic subunit n=1 Tax=Aureimonas sp. Leaf454 TaxID=1736381 RepID=UPI0006FAC948|nr:UDP-forming cellulose synthase catalytic subunit [Aureimonas sp. Leaf454]KQT51967.1 cellulose synthase [Aureimonas sp. Leaf454]